MSIYRLYVLDDVERVETSLETEFPDDASALDQAALSLAMDKAVEVWTGQRLVARLGREFRV
jgi:hypothetical protein